MEKDSNAIYQKNLNQRLGYLDFDVLSGLEYDSGEGNHDPNTIYFVIRENEINLYKGDIRIILSSVDNYKTLLTDNL
jgi:hypothetical protein